MASSKKCAREGSEAAVKVFSKKNKNENKDINVDSNPSVKNGNKNMNMQAPKRQGSKMNKNMKQDKENINVVIEGNVNHIEINKTNGKHHTMNDESLMVFRTTLCANQQSNSCANAEKCPHSHCLTWQRRNPSLMQYSSKLCPEIQFTKTGNKMTLIRRCTKGRSCGYAHSKEEELYHPFMYKTKMCTQFPNCNRYFCPFAHSTEELRRPSLQSSCSSSGEEANDENCYSARFNHNIDKKTKRKGSHFNLNMKQDSKQRDSLCNNTNSKKYMKSRTYIDGCGEGNEKDLKPFTQHSFIQTNSIKYDRLLSIKENVPENLGNNDLNKTTSNLSEMWRRPTQDFTPTQTLVGSNGKQMYSMSKTNSLSPDIHIKSKQLRPPSTATTVCGSSGHSPSFTFSPIVSINDDILANNTNTNSGGLFNNSAESHEFETGDKGNFINNTNEGTIREDGGEDNLRMAVNLVIALMNNISTDGQENNDANTQPKSWQQTNQYNVNESYVKDTSMPAYNRLATDDCHYNAFNYTLTHGNIPMKMFSDNEKYDCGFQDETYIDKTNGDDKWDSIRGLCASIVNDSDKSEQALGEKFNDYDYDSMWTDILNTFVAMNQ